MTDAYHRICIPQGARQQLVCQHSNRTIQLEQAVVRKDSPNPLPRLPLASTLTKRQIEKGRVEHCFVSKTAERCMAVQNLDLFADDDVSQVGQKGEVLWERCGCC